MVVVEWEGKAFKMSFAKYKKFLVDCTSDNGGCLSLEKYGTLISYMAVSITNITPKRAEKLLIKFEKQKSAAEFRSCWDAGAKASCKAFKKMRPELDKIWEGLQDIELEVTLLPRYLSADPTLTEDEIAKVKNLLETKVED